MAVPPPTFVKNLVGQPYLQWNVSPTEQFYVPAAGWSSIQQIPVTASPFVFVNGIGGPGVTVLIGGAPVSQIALLGTFPPSGPNKFVTPPTGPLLIPLSAAQDGTFTLYAGQQLQITYPGAAPTMYVVH